MPLYEFRCEQCDKVSEFQLKMSDAYPTLCPACGKEGLKKIMSLPAFQLKGSGWYKDAYDGKSNKRPEATKPEGSSSTAEASAPAPAAAPATPAPAAPSAPASKPTSGD